MKRPFDQMTKLVRENNVKSTELTKYIFEKSDSMSLWLIGLSVGGISIFSNNIFNIKNGINPHSFRLILFLLAISITTGIIYRFLYLFYFYLESQIGIQYDIQLSNKKRMHIESKLLGGETFQELITIIQDGTGENLNSHIPIYHELGANEQKTFYDELVQHYLKKVEFAKRDAEYASAFIKEKQAKIMGYL